MAPGFASRTFPKRPLVASIPEIRIVPETENPGMAIRKSVNFAGVQHGNPIPAASRIGSLLMSGVISGVPPHAASPPGGPDQCRTMFENIGLLLQAAGGTTDDIIKISVWLKDMSLQDRLNDEWMAMFPDPQSRPARHVFEEPHMQVPRVVTCEVVAVLDG
jgi:enamine deaminase RidA (YjgF/YER057c/UK114 family)